MYKLSIGAWANIFSKKGSAKAKRNTTLSRLWKLLDEDVQSIYLQLQVYVHNIGIQMQCR